MNVIEKEVSCDNCGGTGVEMYDDTEAGCCGKPNRDGSCCGNPIPIHCQKPMLCRKCSGEGIINTTSPTKK